MLKRFASLALLAAMVCLSAAGCEQKKTHAEEQAERVKEFRKKQLDRAIVSYKEIVTEYPDSKYAAQAKARLQKLQPAGSPTPKK